MKKKIILIKLIFFKDMHKVKKMNSQLPMLKVASRSRRIYAAARTFVLTVVTNDIPPPRHVREF